MNGYFLIDKKEDWTSRDVVTKISHIFHERKVGHSGTLDPFATGLLIVSIGRATKVAPYLDGLDKEYTATLKLGSKTSSGDRTNEVVATKEVVVPDLKQIKEVLSSMVGPQKQTPPMVSAVRYKGQKLFTLARQGIEVKRTGRDINIYELELLDFNGYDEITFRAKVSKGTYIRVLGEDVAEKLGNYGHLISLRRTKVGRYDIKDACDTLEVSEDKLINMYDFLNFLPIVILPDDLAIKASHGVPLSSDISESRDILLVADKNHMVIAVYKYIDGKFMCQRGLNDYGNNSI